MPAILIVDNLPDPFLDYELADMFLPFGRIISARLVRDRSGDFMGFGFVELETDHPARVVSTLNGKEIHGQKIIVSVLNGGPSSAA
jgi:polyadenylate-binding protein